MGQKRIKIPYVNAYKTVFDTKESQIPVGTSVNYYSIIGENGPKCEPFPTTIRSEPWKLGDGSVVVKVEGKSGGVAIEHLELIN